MLQEPLLKSSRRPARAPPRPVAMSELDEFFGTLLRIARFVLDFTLTVLCILLLLCALVVPWRFPMILHTFWRKPLSLKKFQSKCAEQFFISICDVLVFAFAAPSFIWVLRWHLPSIKKAWTHDKEREQHGHWSGESRCNLLANAVESYLDVMVLPISLVLLLTPWRFASFHTEGLRQSLVQAKDFHRKLSKLRNWAFCASFSAVVDVPFIAIGLSSLVLPVRLNSLWSILFVKKGFENPKSDCEARGYLCMLPLLTLTDLLAFILGMLAFVNPWRTCTLIKSCHSSWNSSSWVEVSGVSPRFQEATRWNAQLRWMAMKIGLASLMDLLLLPLVLVLTLTFYRAKPVWMELCGDVPSDLDLLPLSKAHRVILKQFGLFLLDIVTLPCLILVLCTWYRYRHMRHKQEQLRQRSESGSSKAEVPAMVVLHDLLLVICSSSLLLSVYRLPKLYRLLTAEVDEALTRDTYDWDLRGKIWEEIGELCLDVPLLPFLLILLFTLWRSDVVLQEIWKAEDNCARRRVVLCQFLELLRDTLGFGALLILVATLVRLPKVLLDIYSQRARQVSGEPRLTLRRVRLVSPDAALQADGRLSVQVEGQQLEQEEMGVIRINVISKSFWDEIGRAFGSSVASLGRALLPYPLKDGKHLKYQDLLNAEVFFELKMGGRELKTKLMQLNAQMAMCVQLEHRTPKGTDEILARLPLPTRFLQEAVRSPGTFVEVPEELLHASAEEVCGPLLCGSGIRNALWLCAFSELWQLILDVLHLFFFLVLALAPWRMLQCAYFAARPSQVWIMKCAEKMVSLLALKEQQLKIYRQGLEPLLNAAAKDPSHRTPEQLQRVVKQQQAKSPVISLKAHRWAELQANESTAHFVDRATAYSSLLDAEASYWPGLILGTNLQLTQECINPHEHALALEKIMAAQALAEEISSKLAREVQAACDELNTEEHKGVSVCRGLCSKSLQEQRHLVRVFVLDMLKDYGCLFLALMLLLSLYRIPAVCNGLFRPSKSRFRERLRVVLNFQMRCLVRDLWMLISTFLCSLAALITLVRALEFLQSAFLYCKNLADLREAALKSTAEAFNSMWELFMLLTLWETYGTLVRATICAVLIPAWGLRCLPHWLRIVFWLSLTALPWLLSFQHALWSYGIILLLFFLLGLWKDGAAARPTPAYLKTLRVTSVNALILLSIVAEPVLLTALVVGVGVSESSATPSTRRLLQSEGSFAAAAAVTLCWLIVMSLPHVMSSESSCLGTVRFHVAMQFLRRACLPAAVVFLAQDGSRGAVSLLLLGFLSFTTILGLDLLSQRHLPDTVNLDLVQPAAFLAGSIFTQVIFVYQLLNGPPMVACISSLLIPGWILAYRVLGGEIGGPLWLFPFQLGLALVVSFFSWAQLWNISQQMLWEGAGFLVLVFLLLSVAVEVQARRWRQKAMEKSGLVEVVRQLLAKLSQKGVLLETPVQELSDGPAVARTLEDCERATRMERLSGSFLVGRSQWLARLRLHRLDLDVVAQCGQQLVEAVCTPPSSLQIFLLMKRKSGRRIPTAIWQMILEFVSDVRYMSKILDPVVKHFNGGTPHRQLLRAYEAMKGVGSRVHNVSLARRCASEPLTPKTVSMARPGIPLEVWCEASGASSASGSRTGAWRRRVLQKVHKSGVTVAKEPGESSASHVFYDFKTCSVRFLQLSLEECLEKDLKAWWKEAPGLYGFGCRCGRPFHPPRRECCYRRHFSHCCTACQNQGHHNRLPHTPACDGRRPREPLMRQLADGCPTCEL